MAERAGHGLNRIARIGERAEPKRAPRWVRGLLSWAPARTTVRVEGVRYRPRRGGRDEFDVAFPTGRPMRIRPTESRVYADLAPDPRAELAALASGVCEPCGRMLDLGCGTGASAAALAHVAGPSGAVIALERDAESVRFARRRYAMPGVGFERGGIEALLGEPAGSFDAVLVASGMLGGGEPAAEVRRVLAPDGVALVVCRAGVEEAGALAIGGDTPMSVRAIGRARGVTLAVCRARQTDPGEAGDGAG